MPCIFCGEPKVTREHIFSQRWMERLFPPQGGRRFKGPRWQHVHEDTSQDGAPTTRIWQSRHAGVVRAACRRCNNGWMGSLDNRAYPILAELMTMKRYPIGISEGTTVASWATKIAMLQDIAAGRGGAKSFTPEDHRRLMEEGVPPYRASVWLAARRATADLVRTWFFVRYRVPPILRPEGQERLETITFCFSNLVFQLAVPYTPPGLYARRAPGREYERALLEISPARFPILAWPPAYVFQTEAEVEEFVRSLGN